LIEANRALLRGLAECAQGRSLLEPLRAVPVEWPIVLYALVEKRAGSAKCSPSANAGLDLQYTNASYAVYRIAPFSRGAPASDSRSGF
jgi:hypothetical protein